MRGKVLEIDSQRSPFRITPAYAGKSLEGERGSVHGEDHPRVCGEKL